MIKNRKPGIYYSFTFKEMFYFLFKKKQCPKCHGMMGKHKEYTVTTDVSRSPGGYEGSMSYGFGGPVKAYKYFFTCTYCKSQYTLNELAYRKG